MPGLFDEFRLKDVTLRNRIAVSPMCQYSSVDGFPTDWHLVHLGARAVGGAGLVVVEATAVTPEGRISPDDSGIWTDAHGKAFERIAVFLKQHGSVAGMQLAHAGRKASSAPPHQGNAHLPVGNGGWEIVAPSPVAFGGELDRVPKEMTVAEIHATSRAFAAAAKRTLDAGFEWLELHFAHGYLASSFFSPLANKRTDDYGGSLKNRARFLVETLAAVREVWPERYPLTARLSVDDYAPGGVTLDESIELTKLLKAGGLDMLDVSMGFNTPDVSGIPWSEGMLAPASKRIRAEAGIPTSVGWLILDPKQADAIVREGQADVVMLAREFLRDPQWPYHAAQTLGLDNPQTVLPIQYARAAKR